MERRDVLFGVGAVAAVSMARVAMAQDHSQHAQHVHGGGKYTGLAAAAAACVTAGQACAAHCLELLGQGDKTMAVCAQTSAQMTSVCATLQQLAAYNSKYLGKYAAVAMALCEDCRAECAKHAAVHAECAACAKACAACAAECKKIAA